MFQIRGHNQCVETSHGFKTRDITCVTNELNDCLTTPQHKSQLVIGCQSNILCKK